jgi:peptidoglycan/xylan/chitin deacetylase (PgdA/CDA1 family)
MIKKILSTILYLFYYKWVNNDRFILLYHSISQNKKDKAGLCIPPKVFKSQIEYLKKNYKIIPLLEFLQNKKGIAITFDDGYKDNYQAFQLLKKLNVPATIFISAEYVGKKVIYPSDKNNPNAWKREHLNLNEIIRMSKSGLIEIGSHCLRDVKLTELSEEEALYQIMMSKRKIENMINKKVICFSYPHGKFNKKIKNMVKIAGYKLACTTIYGNNKIIKDPYELKRIGIYSGDNSLFEFKKKISGTYNFMNLIQRFRDLYG